MAQIKEVSMHFDGFANTLDEDPVSVTVAPARLHTPRRGRTDHAAAPMQGPLQLHLNRMLDEIDYGMVLLDNQGKIWHANHFARAEMGKQQILHEEYGRPCTRLPERQAMLDTAISLALIPLGYPSEALSEALPVVVVTTLNVMCTYISLLFFAQSNELTGAEKSVLAELAQGHQISDIAKSKNVALSTAQNRSNSCG